MEVNAKQSAAWIVDEAKHRGVRAYALTEYLMQKEPRQAYANGFDKTLLLGYGARTVEELKEGIACIRGILAGQPK